MPTHPDRDAWLHVLGMLQAAVRQRRDGMSILTVRLAVQNGELVGWSEATAQRWNSARDSWLASQNVRLCEEQLDTGT